MCLTQFICVRVKKRSSRLRLTRESSNLCLQSTLLLRLSEFYKYNASVQSATSSYRGWLFHLFASLSIYLSIPSRHVSFGEGKENLAFFNSRYFIFVATRWVASHVDVILFMRQFTFAELCSQPGEIIPIQR
jgi:hypothetical protein